MIRAVIYCNTSKGEYYGLRKRIAEEYCKSLNYEIIERYVDFDYYNWDDTRPEYNRLLEDLKSDKFDVIIATTLFNLNASTLKLKEIFKLLEKHNCNLVTIKDRFNFKNLKREKR